MKYLPIDNNLFIKNRKKFIAQMKSKSLAVFNSNDVYPISADSTMPFEQHRDIFYLSGVDQEESILVLFPDCPKAQHREILFLKETNEHIAVWEGEKLTKEAALKTSGIKTVYWLQDLEKILFEIMTQCDTIYINTNEHYRANVETQTREDRFTKWLKDKYPAHAVAKSNPILQRLRSVKEKQEECKWKVEIRKVMRLLMSREPVFILTTHELAFMLRMLTWVTKNRETIFIFDEADEFIPQQVENDSYARSARIAEMLARRGRKFGIGIGICT